MTPLLRFAIALAAFGVLGVAADRLLSSATATLAKHATAAPVFQNAVAAALPRDDARDIRLGGFALSFDRRRVAQAPGQVADAAEAEFGRRLAAWRAARGSGGAVLHDLSLDDLTIPVRLDHADWSMVGVLRAPEGFTDSGFSERRDLRSLAPTDQIAVMLVTRETGSAGAMVSTIQFDAAELAAPGAAMPEGLASLDDQFEVMRYRKPVDDDTVADVVMRASTSRFETAVSRRVGLLVVTGATTEVASRQDNHAIVLASTPEWTATIIFAAAEPGAAVMEIIEFRQARKEAGSL